MENEKEIDCLRWVRVFIPDHVPHYLVEQIRDRDYSVEDFYRYHTINCLTQSEKGFILNPFHHLYVLVDKENHVKGMLWFTVDPLTKDLFVQTYSVDKQYWGGGKAVRKLAQHVTEIQEKAALGKIFWITNYPKHSERYGFKRSKHVLMEYAPIRGKDHGEDFKGGNKKCGKHQPADPATTKLSESSTDGPREDWTGVQSVPAAI